MACQFCQLPTPKILCEVCQYLAEIETTLLEHPSVCQHCRAPIASAQSGQQHCHLCQALLEIAQNNQWFNYAHTEWEQENLLLAKRKRDLLG